MGEFVPDSLFLKTAVRAIRELERLVVETPRANHRLDQLARDVEAVLKRFLRGAHCHACDKKAVLPEIQYAIFCSNDCRSVYTRHASLVDERIREAVSEHLGPEELS